MREIKYPSVPTYYVATGNGYVSHGLVEPNHCMTTGLANLETFLDKDSYINRLSQLGITISVDSKQVP